MRNTDLNANNYFSNAAGQSRPAYHWSDFGGTVGGPVLKDKVFFFFDYEGHRQITPTTLRMGLPSAAERTGNFGEMCAAHKGTFNSAGMCPAAAGQIWDPYMVDPAQSTPTRTRFIPFNNVATYTSPGNTATPWITPGVAGNLINPVAQKLLTYLPLPNVGTPGTAGYNPYNNWLGTGSNVHNGNQYDIKFDSRISDLDNLSVKFAQAWGNSQGANLLGKVMDANTQGPNTGLTYVGAINYTHTFTPKTLLTVSGGYTHSWGHTLGIAANYPSFDITQLGLPASLTSSGFKAPPAIQIGGYSG